MSRINIAKAKSWAEEVLDIESRALKELKRSINPQFVKAVNILSSCGERIVVTGMGKAGIIGQKFSATLSSTGSSSFWIHAAEAVHGDLGRIKENDVVCVLSYSGETEEIRNLIPFVKKIGSKIIAITGNKRSNLAKYADSVVDVKIEKEACPLGLAPTTSTTAMLAMCDAIAVCLQKIKGFKEKDFAFFHPRGSLGRRLLLKVRDIMRVGRFNPVIDENSLVKDVLIKITSSHAGAASIVDRKKKLVGIFTDGDLRRYLGEDPRILERKIKDVMTRNPEVINEDSLASDALRIMERRKIDEIPVVNDKLVIVGMLDVQDLISAGVV